MAETQMVLVGVGGLMIVGAMLYLGLTMASIEERVNPRAAPPSDAYARWYHGEHQKELAKGKQHDKMFDREIDGE